MFRTLALGLLALPVHEAPAAVGPFNVLVVVADDLGTEHLAWHPSGRHAAGTAPTPVLAQLAAEGVNYVELYGAPQCSPARASMLTGRYSFRHGIGDNIGNRAAVLRNGELTLADALKPTAHARGCFGKWHVSRGRLDPNRQGFEHFDGSIEGFKGPGIGYYNWKRTIDGKVVAETGYATTVVTDAAISWIGAQEAAGRPWFAWVAYHAPHNPFQAPPPALNPVTGAQPSDPVLTRYHGMIEALDTELGRLVAAIDRSDTLVLFVGDNGSPQAVAHGPVLPGKAKATAYEGGVLVPGIAWGAGVPALGEMRGFVHLVDVFATVLDAVQVPRPPGSIDSVSLIDPALPPSQHWRPTRDVLFAERFQKNFAPPLGPHKLVERALRGDRYKLVRRTSGDELYDLVLDPWETNDLLVGSVSASAAAAHATLSQRLWTLLASP